LRVRETVLEESSEESLEFWYIYVSFLVRLML